MRFKKVRWAGWPVGGGRHGPHGHSEDSDLAHTGTVYVHGMPFNNLHCNFTGLTRDPDSGAAARAAREKPVNGGPAASRPTR